MIEQKKHGKLEVVGLAWKICVEFSPSVKSIFGFLCLNALMELDKNFDMHLSFFRVILFLLKNRFSSLVRLKNFQNRFGCYLINDDILHLAVLSALLLDFLMQLLINLIRTDLVQTRIRLWGHLTR